ncbi:MAG TPA: pyroglutamyl-peptidase I [Spirochaetales bacterium]|nr:pyroglutamyl-peptidase I [Spirochaetales bacterium]
MRVLITGFEPFGDEAINPAWEAVKRLPDTISGASIVKLLVPTAFGACGAILYEALERHAPDAIVGVGQAGGRCDLSVERVAINVADGRIPDNEGRLPVDEPIQPDGPAAYFSTLPIKAIVARVRERGVPASVSNSAGTYVCNYLMYLALHAVATGRPGTGPGTLAGFVHVPYLPAQAVDKPATTPTMPVETMAAALEAAVEAIVEPGGATTAPEGTIC